MWEVHAVAEVAATIAVNPSSAVAHNVSTAGQTTATVEIAATYAAKAKYVSRDLARAAERAPTVQTPRYVVDPIAPTRLRARSTVEAAGFLAVTTMNASVAHVD